jgi:hypothetical protein
LNSRNLNGDLDAKLASCIPGFRGVKIPWVREIKIPWVGWTKYHGYGVKIPWIGRGSKYHG